MQTSKTVFYATIDADTRLSIGLELINALEYEPPQLFVATSSKAEIKGTVSRYKDRVLLFHLKSTANRDDLRRHACASASVTSHMPHPQPSID